MVENAPAARQRKSHAARTRRPPKRRSYWLLALVLALIVAVGIGVALTWSLDMPPWGQAIDRNLAPGERETAPEEPAPVDVRRDEASPMT